LLVAVLRYCIEVSVERTKTHWRKDRQMEERPWRSMTTSAPRISDMTFDRCSTSHPTSKNLLDMLHIDASALLSCN
jgi:hypothetical protein